jgi:starvation-inducible outer membrane lipoprotein
MKKYAILIAFILAGCSSAPKMLKALKGDQAIVTGQIMTPWGSSKFIRIGGTTNSVTVNADGVISVNGK